MFLGHSLLNTVRGGCFYFVNTHKSAQGSLTGQGIDDQYLNVWVEVEYVFFLSALMILLHILLAFSFGDKKSSAGVILRFSWFDSHCLIFSLSFSVSVSPSVCVSLCFCLQFSDFIFFFLKFHLTYGTLIYSLCQPLGVSMKSS